MNTSMFKEKCDILSEKLDTLNKLIYPLNEAIIMNDINQNLHITLKHGLNTELNVNWVSEITIDKYGILFTNYDISTSKKYIVYTEKSFHTLGLGFMYKDKPISPHVKSHATDLMQYYTHSELKEIELMMDAYLIEIESDIRYLKSTPSIEDCPHYYGEYNSGFDSKNRFDSISSVISDFKSLS